ncbi:MAG: hypothetical protein QUS08_05205 [Methanothrix sp.]|nr:hypothetical protein [Methanothrix sp.]
MVGSESDHNEGSGTGCAMLGHPVPFDYCAACSDGYPCRKVIDCWSHRIDVQEYLTRHYSREEIEKILAPPKPKLLQILELAQKAAQRK